MVSSVGAGFLVTGGFVEGVSVDFRARGAFIGITTPCKGTAARVNAGVGVAESQFSVGSREVAFLTVGESVMSELGFELDDGDNVDGPGSSSILVKVTLESKVTKVFVMVKIASLSRYM